MQLFDLDLTRDLQMESQGRVIQVLALLYGASSLQFVQLEEDLVRPFARTISDASQIGAVGLVRKQKYTAFQVFTPKSGGT